MSSAGDLWSNRDYYWVVECKNTLFHRNPNIFYSHRIPLGETDAVSPRPSIKTTFLVRCDACGMEFDYRVSDVLRCEMDAPESFQPHPLFQED